MNRSRVSSGRFKYPRATPAPPIYSSPSRPPAPAPGSTARSARRPARSPAARRCAAHAPLVIRAQPSHPPCIPSDHTRFSTRPARYGIPSQLRPHPFADRLAPHQRHLRIGFVLPALALLLDQRQLRRPVSNRRPSIRSRPIASSRRLRVDAHRLRHHHQRPPRQQLHPLLDQRSRTRSMRSGSRAARSMRAVRSPASSARNRFTTLACSTITPFGWPVEPDV